LRRRRRRRRRPGPHGAHRMSDLPPASPADLAGTAPTAADSAAHPAAAASTGADADRAAAYPEQVGGREGDALGVVVPDRETFRTLAARQRVVPVSVRLLADEDTPVSLYRRLTADGGTRGTFLLESAGEEIGRASCRERVSVRG